MANNTTAIRESAVALLEPRPKGTLAPSSARCAALAQPSRMWPPIGYARCRNAVTWRIKQTGAALRQHCDRGLATAEYAIATVAAAGFAGLLITVLKSGTVRNLLEGIVKSALSM